ncbi:hypothetical protein I8Y03_001871 [Aeromonas hydrophila]|nr:hypothetical protein [Aeromonas hydrophila]
MKNFDMKVARSYIGNTFFFSSILGIYYFVVFIYYEKIPFPLDSSSLPTIFSALGILGIMLTGIFLFYSSMAIMIVADPLKINYRQVFYTKPSFTDNSDLSGLFNYFIFSVSPILIITAIYLNDLPSWTTLIGLALMPSLFSLHVIERSGAIKLILAESNTTNKTSIALKIIRTSFGPFFAYFITFFYLGSFTIASAVMFYTYVNHVISIDTNSLGIVVMICFIIVNFVITLPSKKQTQYEVNAKKYSSNNILKLFVDLPAAPIYALGIIFSLTPPAAYKNTVSAFKIINSGGNAVRSYYISKNQINTLPEDIIEKCEKYVCITKKMKVVLDMNDVVYVRGDFINQKGTLISLPRKNLQVIIEDSKK